MKLNIGIWQKSKKKNLLKYGFFAGLGIVVVILATFSSGTLFKGEIGSPIVSPSNLQECLDGCEIACNKSCANVISGAPRNTCLSGCNNSCESHCYDLFPQYTRLLSLKSPMMQGEDVKQVQERLIELGFTQVDKADGIFGPMTKSAVLSFQSTNKIQVDGIVGQQTWGVLFSPDALGYTPSEPVVPYDYVRPIDDFYVTPGHFDPTANESGNLHFELKAPGRLSVKIVDASDYGRVYRTIVDNQTTIPGVSTYILDGKNNNGVIIPPGNYRAAITLVHDHGSAGVYPAFIIDQPRVTPQPEAVLQVTNVIAEPDSFEPGKSDTMIKFTLNKKADVEVLIYVEGSRIKYKFSLLAAGSYGFRWDGKDSEGRFLKTNKIYQFDVIATAGNETVTKRGSVRTYASMDYAEKNCADFPDVSVDDPDCEAIKFVKRIGAMTGMDTGNFNPNGSLQRDQIAKISLAAFDLFKEGVRYCRQNEKPFPDIGINDWSYEYVCRAKQLGVVTGYKAGEFTGLYKPTRLVSRGEFLAILLRNVSENMSAYGLNYSDIPAEAWYKDYARYAKINGLYHGNTLSPDVVPSRKEVARIIYKMHQLGKL